ncbi:hypothetical protein BDV32DRAFT_151781 [Aspergillus pseudonomiae]|nr:hypothetical protein BDV32DRAFT_151781 [Aspergillus pseudonomiae]
MSTNVKKSSWRKKRYSESSRAKSQQRQRRKRDLFKKAAKFSLECESDEVVAMKTRKTSQAYIFDSSSQEEWLKTLPSLAFSYPFPIHQTMEDIMPQL